MLATAATLLVGSTAACSSAAYDVTAVPKATSSTAATTPPPAASTTPPGAASSKDQCLQTYRPLASVPKPGAAPGATLAAIRKRKTLRVGVSADSLLLGARNPLKADGPIEGFDIDMADAVSKAIFGSVRVEPVVLTAAERFPALDSGQVDLVARAMSITCGRWNGTDRDASGRPQQAAFSAEYYLAGQRLLVPKGSRITSPKQLSGKRVCAPASSTSLTTISQVAKGAVVVPAATHTACLALFQQSKVDAITGDDTVLAGLAAQDPYAKVVGPRFSSEPYGLGVKKGNVDLVRFVNAVLAQMAKDGSWTRSYDHWLKPALKVAATQPKPDYGRALP